MDARADKAAPIAGQAGVAEGKVGKKGLGGAAGETGSPGAAPRGGGERLEAGEIAFEVGAQNYATAVNLARLDDAGL